MSNELKRRVDLPESSHAWKLARSDDVDERGWVLEPEHTIFLSHSGQQKNFTEWLSLELKRAHHYPFLDKWPDSLPKGHDFPSAIIQAARQCHVAILVLSEDFFTRSRWPMIELNEFVKAQASTNSKLKLLPLFYKISVADFKDAERQKRWQDVWRDWAADDMRSNVTHKLDVGAWAFALSVVGKVNGLEYVEADGEVTYVAKVVDAVRKLKLPRVKYDVSHVQSLGRLCEVILGKFHDTKDDHDANRVQSVGLFGMGGVGKTTISKAICNGLSGDFDGEFCHVEFGMKDLVVLRRQVLQDLSGDDLACLPHDLHKLKTLLKKYMQQHKVFLCLDNVLLHGDMEEAQMYLNLTYEVGSKVLVTLRSRAILESLGLGECHCMEMPELDKCDATKLFLHYIGLGSMNNFNKAEQDVISGCVEACLFLKGSSCGVSNDSKSQQYLPLALKVWGTQLGQISKCPLEWKTSLEKLSIHKFNHFNEDSHPLFSLLRQGYDSLKPRDQFFFLDLAILVTSAIKLNSFDLHFDTVKWLQHAYGCEIFSIMQSLEALKRKALLDFAMIDKVLEFRIHDLYLEFAKEEVQALESTNQTNRFLYVFGKGSLPSKLWCKWECRNLKRLAICESEVKSMKREDLFHCSQVEVFQVYGCKNLEELVVEGMCSLRILDVLECKKLVDIRGVNKLKDLKWLRLEIWNTQLFLGDLSSMTTLEFLALRGAGVHYNHHLDLSGCINLRELIQGWISLPDLSNLVMLERVRFWGPVMMFTVDLNSLVHLKVLDLSECGSLVDLPGLCNLVALETLNVDDTSVEELHGIGKLQHLQELSVSYCEYLTSLVELEYVTSLRRLEASNCNSLHELPSMINLKKLEVVDLSMSAIMVVPGGFGRLAKNRILNLSGCVELLEPLMLWLWEQEQLLVQGQNDEISSALSHIEETEDEFWSSTRKVVAYYMDQVSSTAYERDGLVSSVNILGKKEGGIDFTIKAMCDYEDLGILSLVVAKYSTKIISKISIPKLCSRIIEFLTQQLNQDGAYYYSFEGYMGHPTFWRILFVLEYVMENDMLMESLEVYNIHLFLEKFNQDGRHFDDIWKFYDFVDPIFKRWASYLQQCCFEEDCECSEYYSKEE